MAGEDQELAGSTVGAVAPVTDGSQPAGEAGADAAQAATNETDIWARLAEADPDEVLRRLPRLQGKVGALAQSQAQKQLDAFKAEQAQAARVVAEQADRAERQRLARENPDALAERVLVEEATRTAAEQDQSRWQAQQEALASHLQEQLNGVYAIPVVKELWEKGDDAAKAKLDWRKYPTFAAFVESVAEAVAESKADARAEVLAKARVEAMTRDGRVQRMAGEAQANGADLGLGGIPGGRLYSAADLASMPLEEYRKNRASIEAQAAQGLIK